MTTQIIRSMKYGTSSPTNPIILILVARVYEQWE